MDAFYASVEQRDFPEYRNQPVVVGGSPYSRGVVCTASYEARKFGIHSAMSCSKAYRLCPQAIFVQPRGDVYRMVSKQIREIFLSCTDLVEPLSLDEAYLDVTKNKFNCPSATIIAQYIQKQIYNITRLTCSAGVSYNKFLAKTASDIKKPVGLTVIKPSDADRFMENLPIKKFYGIGKRTAQKMHNLNIYYGKDLLKYTKFELLEMFGKNGLFLFDIVRGIDNRVVNPSRERKSFGRETTFNEDIADFNIIKDTLFEITEEVCTLMKQANLSGRTVSLKVKYSDFSISTRSISEKDSFNDLNYTFNLISKLIKKTEITHRAVRLLGVTFSNLDGDNIGKKNKIKFDCLFYQPELPLPF